jgi:hypothetical protein
MADRDPLIGMNIADILGQQESDPLIGMNIRDLQVAPSQQDLSSMIGGNQAEIYANPKKSLGRLGLEGIGEGAVGTLGLLGDIGATTAKVAENIDLSKFSHFGPPGLGLQAAQFVRNKLPRLTDNYSPGDVMGKLGEIYNEYVPRKSSDTKGVRTAASFVGGGGAVTALGKGITKIGAKGGLEKVGKILGDRAGLSTFADTVGGTAAGLTEVVAPEKTGLQAAAGFGGSLAGRKIGLAAIPTAKGLLNAYRATPKNLDEAQEVLSGTMQNIRGGLKEIDAKAPAKAERMAVERFKRVVGGDLEFANFLKAVDELPANQKLESLSSISERLIDHPEAGTAAAKMAGYLRHLEENADLSLRSRFIKKRDLRQEKREQRLQKIRGDQEDVSAGAAFQAGKSNEREMASNVNELFEAIDPQGTSRIPIGPELAKVKKNISKEFPAGLDSETERLIKTFKQAEPGISKAAEPSRIILPSFVRSIDTLPSTAPPKNEKTWQMLNDLRGKANDLAYKKPKSREAVALNRIRNYIMEAGKRAAETGEGFTPQQQKAWQEAIDASRNYKKIYEAKGIPRLLDPEKTDPSSIAPKFLSRNTTIEQAQRMMKVVPKEQRANFRAGIIDELLTKNITATDSVDMRRIAKQIRENGDKLALAGMSKSHIKNLEGLARNIARERKTEELGKQYAKSFAKGVPKSWLEALKEIFTGRVRWKYPAEAKVIQLASNSGKNRMVSLNDLIEEISFEMAYDPVTAKTLVRRYKPDLVDSAKYQKISEEAIERAEGFLSRIADFAIGGTPRASVVAAGQSRRDLTMEKD